MLATILTQSATLEAFAGRARDLFAEAADGTLALLLAFAVLAVGWLIARLARLTTRAVLRRVGFDTLAHRLMGASSEPPRVAPSSIAAIVVHWTILGLTAVLAADALGLDLGGTLADRLRDALPRVAAATIELVAGIAVAMVLGEVARRLFASAGVRGSRARGQIVSVVIGAFAVLVALEQLGLAAEFIMALGITAMAAAGLTIAVAFGLGCRDLARDFVIEYLRSLGFDDLPPR